MQYRGCWLLDCWHTDRGCIIRILRRPEVLAVTGLCYTSIFNMMKLGKFPASRKLGARAVGWIEKEVEEWMESLQGASSVN